MQNVAKLILVFNETQKKIKNSTKLTESVEKSIKGTRLYMEGEFPELPEKKNDMPAKVEVSGDSSFQAALRLRDEYRDAKIAVHNFASAINPGGGVVYGATAQEESLCRCSTLYPVLKTDNLEEEYYRFHRKRHSAIYTDACIFSPDILILKDDSSGNTDVPENKWCAVDILTCAAPNLSVGSVSGIVAAMKITKEKLREIHIKRAKQMLTIAAAHGDEVLVLGAFGCGAFANDPEVVADAYKEVINEFSGYFKHIEFAVYSPEKNSKNYKTFNRLLKTRR